MCSTGHSLPTDGPEQDNYIVDSQLLFPPTRPKQQPRQRGEPSIDLEDDSYIEEPSVDLEDEFSGEEFPEDWIMFHLQLRHGEDTGEQLTEDEPLYPCNTKVIGTCQVCLGEKVVTRERLCCKVPVCEPCMAEYLKNAVEERNVRMQCINCDSYVHRDEILALLPIDLKEKYYRFLIDENKHPDIKTCPRCCLVQHRHDSLPHSSTESPRKPKTQTGPQVICTQCGLNWCFDCHAPWHENIRCREFLKGDKLVKNWAKEFSYGQKNAVRCPKCKIFIQKRSGCNHMSCQNCNTKFCYRCGHRYFQLKLIGKHSDKFSPFGCKYNLLPDKPVARKAIRGSVLGAKIFGGVLLGGLIVAAAAVFLGGSVIIVPSYFGVRYYHYRKRQKVFRKYKKQREESSRLRMEAQSRRAASMSKKSVQQTLIDVELGKQYVSVDTQYHSVDAQFNSFDANTDTLTSTESSSSNDHYGSTEVKVWVHSENKEDELGDDVNFKFEEEQTTSSLHDNTVTTAEVTMENNVVVLHVTTTSKAKAGDLTPAEHAIDGSMDTNVKKDDTEELKASGESLDETVKEVNDDSQGCFIKILGKLPVKWEKEDEKEAKLKENVIVKPTIIKDKKRKIGTRRVRNKKDMIVLDDLANMDSYEKLSRTGDGSGEVTDLEIQNVKQVCDVVDPYIGIVSTETCDTSF